MIKLKALAAAMLLLLPAMICQAQQFSPVIDAAKNELNRTMTELKSQQWPPYFISYSITDSRSVHISSSFGEVESSLDKTDRILDIDLRVGDYKFDNTHIIRGASFSFGSGRNSTDLPLDNDEKVLRSSIWYATDRCYKKAVETYEKALTNKQVKVQEEDTSADFSHEQPSTFYGPVLTQKIDKDAWTARLNRLSSKFNTDKWIYDAKVYLDASILRKYFVNSEGSVLEWSEPTVRVFVTARTKADDGMNLPLYLSYFAYTPDSLPSEAKMSSDIDALIETLSGLRTAPLMTTYTGPAILSGEAAGVFFHEIFGHRVEGQREKDPNSSQTFRSFVGKKILPNFIDVIFDPSLRNLAGKELAGYYQYDDEGIRGMRVDCVDSGIFRNFLMSRSPIEGFSQSNGHGRKQAGYKAVSRQSNLVVVAHTTVPIAELKEKLREECKKQGKDYGLLLKTVSGGFTYTGRTVPNAFNVQPLVVYKIFADGREDELVRGVDLIGTPLTTFSNIIAAGNDMGVFNGICGAESGGVPVSASSPSLLVSSIEVQKKQKSQAKPPILSAP